MNTKLFGPLSMYNRGRASFFFTHNTRDIRTFLIKKIRRRYLFVTFGSTINFTLYSNDATLSSFHI